MVIIVIKKFIQEKEGISRMKKKMIIARYCDDERNEEELVYNKETEKSCITG